MFIGNGGAAMEIHAVGPDITVLNDDIEVPGMGWLAVNSFVLRAAEPVVIDTGLSLPGRGFMEALGSVIDPADVRWIWLTHPDRDHTGALFELLEAAPRARVVTTFLGAGLLSCATPLPMDRVYFLNPGETLDVGDRRLHAFRPPLFDSPATVGFYDDRTRACFSSDCFGAPLPGRELAVNDDAGQIPSGDLRDAQLLWATVDSPWIHTVDLQRFAATIQPLREMNPEVVLSSHLPPARNRDGALFEMLLAAPGADAFSGPDQQALEAMLATFELEDV
jgi:glyoxylase-like metal-dependent hydrolase (beta-lactamase superfamily II)